MAICAPLGNFWDDSKNGYVRTIVRTGPIPQLKQRSRYKMKHSLKPLLPKKRSKDKGKLTVVLDMDETLLHSVWLDNSETLLGKLEKMSLIGENDKHSILQEYIDNADLVLNISGDSIAVKLRPGLPNFLKRLSKTFEVVLFTAADRKYAEPLLNQIDPNHKYLPYRLYREHTINFKGTKYVKDLSRLGRNLKRTVLIDNNIMAMRAFPNNCVLTKDYYGDPKDNQLGLIWSILSKMRNLSDVRPTLINAYSIAKRIENLLLNPDAIKEPAKRNGSYRYKER